MNGEGTAARCLQDAAAESKAEQVVPDTTEQEQRDRICGSIAVRSQLVSPVIRELCTSISSNLSSTTEPISAELLRIRQTGQSFLNGIRTYESDVKNHTTENTLQRESELFDRDLKALSQTVDEVFASLEDHITELRTIPETIGDIAADIGEISEQIRILSFNASVEAARAGSAGAGFRVIAGEIKRLSADTGTRLEEIKKNLYGTKRIFTDIETGLEQNRRKMSDVVSRREAGFVSFRQQLEDYFPKLEQLYDGVTDVIESLKKSMDVISPVVQLHEITRQEIGNLGRMADDFCLRIRQDAESACRTAPEPPGQEAAGEVFNTIRERLTTENELEALGRGIRETVPGAQLDSGVNSRRIELF